ncbi:MAG TPA: FAD-dependent tricarballylate dehydrogenase TcuA [Candidatus Limnocylindrales bacterium]|nr:FAD-dependent tricarballylate dehydrogenase TcuA [Candidatus Limnocylindrales bacterium]
MVIGAGSAGLASAVAAADAGARQVLVLEKGTRDEVGGNARFSHTGFRATYGGPADIRPFVPELPPDRWSRLLLPGYSAADFAADLDRATDGRIDPGLRDRLAGGSAPALEWMRDLGIPWSLNRTLVDEAGEHFEPGLILAAGRGGGGRELVEAWLALAAERGIEVRFEAPVVDVRLGTGRSGHEITIGGPTGGTERAAALVVCSGGFQADEALRIRHLGEAYARVPVRGTPNDTGEVLELLVREGAARDGTWESAVVTPVDADSPAVGGGNDMNRYSYPWGITVDRHGRRFFDEGAGRSSDTYGSVGRLIVERADGRAWQIFDAVGARYLKEYAYRFARVVEADTIGALATAAGIDAAGLARTVREFNAAVRTALPFDPTTLDARRTRGIEPPKSNWAVALERPPFRAYPVTGGLTFTLGGLRIDRDARVLAANGRPLPGVFASGDVVGLFHGDYPSGAGQTRNVVFGRLAGEGAARWASE